MSDVAHITRRLEGDYQSLAPQPRKVARYVVKAPTKIALGSLREVAERAAVGPTTLVRLAAQLGYPSYNAFRETFVTGCAQALTDTPATLTRGAGVLTSLTLAR
jgi:DNA-binding MurR/RpiR family transcriptional regulator